MSPLCPIAPSVHARRPPVGLVEVRIRGVPSVAMQSRDEGHEAPPQLRIVVNPAGLTRIGRENDSGDAAAVATAAPSTNPPTAATSATLLLIYRVIPPEAPARTRTP